MNNQIPETDQWKLNGNCEKCRRKEYCHTKCGASKRRWKGLYNALGNAMIDALAPTQTIADNAKKYFNGEL